MSSLQVLTPNGRRQTVKCNANTTILEVLEIVCSKHQFDVDTHELKHHNKVLDVSLPFRFTGLPNNAQLEMVPAKATRKTEPALIGLNLESGERVTGTFSPGQTLQEVIESLAPQRMANPVIIYMRKEVFGAELSTTTLKMCGITSGRAMLRLVDRKPEDLKNQANVSVTILPKPPSVEAERPRQHQPTNPEHKNVEAAPILGVKDCGTEQVHSLSQPSTCKKYKQIETESGEILVQEPIVEHQIITLGERNAVLFSLETVEQTIFDDIPDSFFEVTVSDVKKLQYERQQAIEAFNNQSLKTSAMRKSEEQQKRDTIATYYKQAILRIQLPERFVLQATFSPEERIEDVKQFVRTHLKDPTLDFDLFTTPPKRVLDPSSDLFESGCVPLALVHFGTELPHSRYLKDELYDKVCTAAAAAFSVIKLRDDHSTIEMKTTENTTAGGSKTALEPSEQHKPRVPTNFIKSKAGRGQENFPKWFKP